MNKIRNILLITFFFTFYINISAQNLVACSETDSKTKITFWGFSDRFYREAVIPCIYDTTFSFTEGLGAFRKNGKFGFVDKAGKQVIAAKYDGATPFSEGFAAVYLDGKSFFIDKKGTDVFKKTFKTVSPFSNGLAMCAGEDGKRGFIDTKGNIAVPLTLEAAHPFQNGLAPVRLNGEKTWKAINSKGEVIFNFPDKVKTVMGPFSEGLTKVYVDGPSGYNVHYDFVNAKGDFICDAPYASAQTFKNSRAIIAYENKNRKSGDLQIYKYGLIKNGGREIVSAKYACLEESPIPGIYFYGITSASISNCSGYGLLDSMGKEITQPKYSSFTRLNDTTFLCKEADKGLSNRFLLMTTNGRELIPLRKEKKEFNILGIDTLLFLWSETFDRKLLVSIYHTKQGLLKDDVSGVRLFKKQKLLLLPEWEFATGTLMTSGGQILMDKIQSHVFTNDTTIKGEIPFILISTDKNKDFKMFNLHTRKIMANDYGFKNEGNPYYSGEFSEGLLPIQQKGKWGFIDTAGKIKLPSIYERAENFRQGWAVVGKKKKNAYGEFDLYDVYINKAGKELPGLKASYLNASEFKDNFAHYKKEGYSEVVRYIDKTGKEIFKSESDKYFEHGDFSNGLAAVPNKEGKYGYINTKGELVIPYQYTIPKTQYASVNSIAFDKYGYATVVKDGKTTTISKPGK